MNIRNKFKDALDKIKERELDYTNKVNIGSKDIKDAFEMSYFSGLHNGYNFVWYILEHPEEMDDELFDTLLNKILHKETVN